MARKVVTVDGLAGSGKSTLAGLLAEKLGFVHFNSGLLYRSVGYLAINNGVDVNDRKGVLGLMQDNKIELCRDEKVIISDKVIPADALHLPQISEATSIISSFPEVRERLVELQRQVFPGSGLVAEGRDMGTVIFPDAAVKFFVEASCDVRVARRLAQFKETHPEMPLDDFKRKVEIEIMERDARDRNRQIAPTVAADDAILVDNSTRSLTEVVQYMYDICAERGVTA